MKRAGRKMRNMAESTYNGMQDWMRWKFYRYLLDKI
jgi:hypothetical protein